MPRPKRSHGDGGIKKRADGRYEGRIVFPDGRRKSVYGKTRREAQLGLAQLRRDMEDGRLVASADMTVGQYLAGWLERRAKRVAAGSLAPRTYDKDASRVETHIQPTLGRIKLTKLTGYDVERLQDGLIGARLASPTVHGILATLRAALNDAVARHALHTSPMAGLDIAPDTRAKVDKLSRAQADAIIAAAKGTRYEAAIVLAVWEGMRQGEIVGLRWQDIDLDEHVITIDGALGYVPRRVRNEGGAALQWKAPKTEQSQRALPLLPDARVALVAHGQRQMMEGQSVEPLAYVFTTESGALVYGWSVTQSFQRAIRRAGLPHIRFRDLRHGAASLWLAAGVPVPVVQALLGHATARMVLDIYARMPDETLRDGASRVHEMLRGADSATDWGHDWGQNAEKAKEPSESRSAPGSD